MCNECNISIPVYFFPPDLKMLKLCLFIKDEFVLVHPSISITIISVYNLLCFRLADCHIEACFQFDKLIWGQIPVPIVDFLKERL